MSEIEEKSLKGRTLYLHPMTTSGATLLAACMRSRDIDAHIVPPSDAKTLELGNMYSSGEECFPEKITIGDYLKVTEQKGFDPKKTAFLMPSANGPCRFGQYEQLLSDIFKKRKLDDIMIMSPSSKDGYSNIGGVTFFKTAWVALITADILRKLLLKTRPYEKEKGTSDNAYKKALEDLEKIFELSGLTFSKRMKLIVGQLENIRDEFRAIDAEYIKGKPLIGVVGEIFCRLNRFANEEMIRKLESYGAETWLADVGEWVIYTDWSKKDNIKRQKGFCLDVLKVDIKTYFMKKYEHTLYSPFHSDFEGYEEPRNTEVIVKLGEPYLPAWGALGEMALSTGRAIYLQEKGADGIVDISPFSCMNGIVSEAIYPSLSKDYNNIPCRVFYYDGTNLDIDRDIGIFMELVKGYMSKKNRDRKYPKYFR